MDHKRKAGASKNGDRDNKRRRTESMRASDYDLSQGESKDSTTAYGLTFLQMLRTTQDKSGRRVAGYFEKLPIKSRNESYYKKIQMPISLDMVERHLRQGDFEDLSALESYIKRMVTNAKEYHNKNSQEYEDAERIRKATSNYMTKHNPAYKKVTGYTAQATPLSAEPEQELEDELAQQGSEPSPADQDDDGDDGNEAGSASEDNEDEEEDEDEDEEDDKDGDEDAEGEEDEEGEEADDDDDEEDQPPRRSRNARIVINVNKTQPEKSSQWKYEETSYQGLSFQKAQEKVVEELLRREDDEGELVFVNFINLPSRQFKEYYNVIQNPLSLTGLQKLVLGKKGRQPPTGKTELGTWNAFLEKAAILWDNAHYFNEEGSEVYEEATKLKEHFMRELEKAKAAAPEPLQAKIKLKVLSGQETPSSRKVSINVGSSSASPAPPTGRSTANDSQAADTPVNGTHTRTLRGASGAVAVHSSVSQARSQPASIASPSPAPASAAPEAPLTNGTNGNSIAVPNGHHAPQSLPNGPIPPMIETNPALWEGVSRAPGRAGVANALIEKLTIRSRTGKPDDRFKVVVPAHPALARQTVTVHVPAGHHHLQLVAQLAPLEQQGRQYKLFVQWQDKTLPRSVPAPSPEDPLPPNALVFDTQLQPGGNRINVIVVAALPKADRVPNGLEGEVEWITILAHHATH